MRWARWLYILPLRLRSIFRHGRVEQEMEEELRFHLECKREEGMHRGLDSTEAHYRALRAMAGLQQQKEEIRDMRHIRWFSDFAADLRYAARAVGHAKLFTALVVFTLALGIGANSAVFSLADALILRPLPVLRPSEVVTLSTRTPDSSSTSMGLLSYRDYVDYRDKSTSFYGVATYSFLTNLGFAPRAGDLPKLKGGLFVSGNLLRVMGVQPQLGRDFTSEEDQVPGRNAVAILGNDFWQSQMGRDPSVIGRHVLFNNIDFTIIGVAPKKFFGLDQYTRPDVYMPLMMWPHVTGSTAQKLFEDREDRELVVKARLKPNVPIAQARAELHVIAQNLQRAYPKTNRDRDAFVRTEMEMRLATDPNDAAITGLLLALAGAVLLIACANVAGLLLGRARSRSREIAVRLAIGAGRFRLIRLLLAESFLIALMGGAVGIVFGYAGVKFFSQFKIPTDLPIRLAVQLDRRMLLFSIFISLLSAMLCGLAPALQTTRTNLVTALKTADADIPGKRKLWGRNTLVICQVAASLALLTCALQMVRTFHEKWRGGPGFRTDHLMTMAFDPQLAHYTEAQTQKFYKDLVQRTRQLSGVQSAALIGAIPMGMGNDGVRVIPEGYSMPAGKENFSVEMTVAGDRLLETLGVQLLKGREFVESDTVSSPKVAVVNEQFAQHYWPNANALGKRFRIGAASDPLVQIVGIAKTAKYDWIGESPMEFIYLPLKQKFSGRLTLLVQSKGPSESLAEPVRELMRNLDSRQPMFDVRTIEEYYERRVVAAPLMIVRAVSAMGLIGLTLALAGLYGLVTFAASRRTREIGIRMAIGADRKSVLYLVLRQALFLTIVGSCLGLLLGLGAEKGLHAVFETSGTDITAYLLIVPALFAATLLAAWIPARRASRIEPSRALRYE